MNCPKCGNIKNQSMDIFSIKKQGRCVSCQDILIEESGFSASKNEYKVFIRFAEDYKIFADSEQEAIDIATERFENDFSSSAADVEVTKLRDRIAPKVDDLEGGEIHG